MGYIEGGGGTVLVGRGIYLTQGSNTGSIATEVGREGFSCNRVERRVKEDSIKEGEEKYKRDSCAC